MLKAIVKDFRGITEYEEKTAHDFIDAIWDEVDFTSEFDEMLDECYEGFDFGGATYSPSLILSKVDPIMYDTALTEYKDSRLYNDFLYELEQGEKGDFYIGDCDITIIENDEE